MSVRKEISAEVRILVLNLSNEGKSIANVGQIVSLSKSKLSSRTIRKINIMKRDVR